MQSVQINIFVVDSAKYFDNSTLYFREIPRIVITVDQLVHRFIININAGAYKASGNV